MNSEIRDVIAEGSQQSAATSAPGKVMEYIKNKIVYREWIAGDRLPTEPELCKLVNVSRTAVREAIKILEANNIVRIRRGDGTYISDSEGRFSFNFILFRVLLQNISYQEMDSFRDAIELEMMRFVISNAEEDEITLLKESYQEMAHCIEHTPEDYIALHTHDMNFHYLLADICHNSLLRETYLSVLEIYSPLILRNYQSGQEGGTGLRVHALMLEAIVSRDFVSAAHAVKSSVDLCSDWVRRSEEGVDSPEENVLS